MNGRRSKEVRREVYGGGYARNEYELRFHRATEANCGTAHANPSRKRYQKAKCKGAK